MKRLQIQFGNVVCELEGPVIAEVKGTVSAGSVVVRHMSGTITTSEMKHQEAVNLAAIINDAYRRMIAEAA